MFPRNGKFGNRGSFTDRNITEEHYRVARYIDRTFGESEEGYALREAYNIPPDIGLKYAELGKKWNAPGHEG